MYCGLPPVSTKARPRAMISMASVATKGISLTTFTMKPFSRPMTVPTSTGIRNTTGPE